MSPLQSPGRSIFISPKQIAELEAFAQFTGIPEEKLLQVAIDDWLHANGPVVAGSAQPTTTAHMARLPGKPNLWGR